MDRKMVIRHLFFVKHKPKRWIARELGIHRDTVERGLLDPGPPRYELKVPRPAPLLDPVKDLIDGILRADQDAPCKQRHNARRIFDRLVEEQDFKGSYSHVRRYVAKRRWELGLSRREVFLPIAHPPNGQAQADWGEALVILEGRELRLPFFVVRLVHSTRPFVCAFPSQKQEALFEGHRRCFEYLGGVPSRIRYDNMRTAIQKMFPGHVREEHELFLALRTHYLFEAFFCNAGRGNEKGSVENLVGYLNVGRGTGGLVAE